MTAPTLATGRRTGRPDRPRANRDVYEKVTASIVSALESGTVPWQRPWNGAKLSLPANAITRRRYHGLNVLALLCEAWAKGYPSSHWLTFNQARTHGLMVRRGERGTAITFMRRLSRHPDPEQADDTPSTYLLARCFHVFNVAQLTDLEPGSGKLDALRARCGVTVERAVDWSPVEQCERVLAAFPVPTVEGPQAAYFPLLDHITMPPRSAFPGGPEAYYPTWFHEAVHSTGHESRLARDLTKGPFGSPAYAFEELVAELGSAFLSQRAGLDHVSQASAYLASWLTALKEQPDAIIKAARLAQQAADYVWPDETDDSNDPEPGDAAGLVGSVDARMAA